jgi:hypothetical protein
MKFPAFTTLIADKLEPRVAAVERVRVMRERLPLIEAHKLRPILDEADLDAFRVHHLGKGGNGDLTPGAIAFVLASFLLDVPRPALTEKTLELCAAEYDGDGDELCPLTGQKLFIDALSRILTDREIFARALAVRVSAERPECADIFFPLESGETVFAPFCGDNDLQPAESALECNRTLHFEKLAFLLDITAPELEAV